MNIAAVIKGRGSLIARHCRKINFALLGMGILVFLAECLHWRALTVDDAFISFRYADNLASGHGFSWNYDGIPVFGFSNYLLVIVSAAAIKSGLDPVIFSKALGAIAGLSSIILIGYLLKELTDGNFRYYFVTSFVWAFVPWSWIHAVAGLETSLFALLVLLSSYLYACFLKRGRLHYLYLTVLCLTVAILCRYEGAIIAATVIIHHACHTAGQKKPLLAAIRALAPFSLPVGFLICLLTANLFYFGQLMPNSAYVKSASTLWDVLSNAGAMVHFLVPLSPFLVLILLGLEEIMRSRCAGHILIQPVVFLLPFVLVGQAMNYLSRFYYPVAPLVIVAGTQAFIALGPKLKKFPGGRSGLVSIGLVWVLLATCAPVFTYQESMEYGVMAVKQYNRTVIPIGKILGKYNEKRNYKIATVVDGGAIPYYSRWQVFDYELNDARRARHGFNREYFYQQSPDIITMTFYIGTDEQTAAMLSRADLIHHLAQIQPIPERKEIITHPLFQAYTLATVFGGALDYRWGYYTYIFVKASRLSELDRVVSDLRDGSTYW